MLVKDEVVQNKIYRITLVLYLKTYKSVNQKHSHNATASKIYFFRVKKFFMYGFI